MDARRPILLALEAAARRWIDPDYPARARAVDRTLELPNRFTAEATAFSVNQQMSLVTADALEQWRSGRSATRPELIGVLNAGNVPFVGLQDLLAVLITGHRYLGVLSSRSPFLLPAFVDDAKSQGEAIDAAFLPFQELIQRAERIIATGTSETRDMVKKRVGGRRSPDRLLLRGHRFGVAVLSGNETDDELDRFAEDVLLHEGLGCRNSAIVWCPRSWSPDPVLDALARFRAVFPSHPDTPGTLSVQRAFLAAVDASHAYAEDHSFVVSRGAPEVQTPGHLRWVSYDDLGEAVDWISKNAADIQVVASQTDRVRSMRNVAVCGLGETQRPPLDWQPDGKDTIAFLTAD